MKVFKIIFFLSFGTPAATTTSSTDGGLFGKIIEIFLHLIEANRTSTLDLFQNVPFVGTYVTAISLNDANYFSNNPANVLNNLDIATMYQWKY